MTPRCDTSHLQAVPPTVSPSILSVGWPTPTGTLCPSLPQVPTPSSSFRSLPTIETRISTSGPLPIRVAPLRGAPTRPFSMAYASLAERAVIDYGALRRRNLLADAAGECGGALAVEVSLEPVPDRLVQQDSRPARTQHHRHGAGWRRPRLEVDERLAHRFARQSERPLARDELGERIAAAGAGVALFAPAALFHQHRDVETHQRTHVRGQLPVAGGDEHHFVHRDHARGDVHDARIDAPRLAIDTFEPGDLVRGGERGCRVRRQIQPMPGLRPPRADAPLPAMQRDGARGT